MIDGFEAQKLIASLRGDALVVATMTANWEWPQVSTRPELDLPLVGCMGKASSVGLGLALARPDKKVIVLDGDGSLLMNLGSLVTIANKMPPNLIHIVFDNGVYRTTGGQPVPGAGRFNFVALAEAAGYSNAHGFEKITDLRRELENILAQPGPTLICLKVPAAKERPPYPMRRTTDALSAFRAALQRPILEQGIPNP